MINLLLGAPGGGKSYEAVVYHVLPALKRGRKVVTNLPLNLEALGAIDDTYPALVELRDKTCKPRTETDERYNARPFSNPEDYADTWKADDGTGCLYIVDECHFALPRLTTPIAVEEWYSMHRHYNVDVLLITQSSGKINQAIRDLIQTVYKVRKAVAFGKSDGYIRKVLDGVNGGEIQTSERKYKPEFFKLYRSHTKGASVAEQQADDVAPLSVKWRRFTIAFWICLVPFIAWAFWPGGKPIIPTGKPALAGSKPLPPMANPASFPARPQTAVAAKSDASAPTPMATAENAPSGPPEPFGGKTLHLSGRLQMGSKVRYQIAVAKDGAVIGSVTDDDLVKVGYKFTPQTDCIASLTWAGKERALICDTPKIPEGTYDRPVVVAVPGAPVVAKSQ